MNVPVTQATGQSVTLTIDDNNNDEIFNSGAKSENATYTFNVNEPVTGEIDVSIDFGGSVGSTDHATVVTLRGI